MDTVHQAIKECVRPISPIVAFGSRCPQPSRLVTVSIRVVLVAVGMLSLCVQAGFSNDPNRVELISISVTSGKDFRQLVKSYKPREEDLGHELLAEIRNYVMFEDSRLAANGGGEYFPDLSGSYLVNIECKNVSTGIFMRAIVRLDENRKILREKGVKYPSTVRLQDYLRKIIGRK